MKTGMMIVAWSLLAVACAGGGWTPTLAELVQRETVVRGFVDEARLDIESHGCVVLSGAAEILVAEVIVGDVEVGSTLRVGGSGGVQASAGREPVEVFVFIKRSGERDDVVFRRVPHDAARTSLHRGIDMFRMLGASIDTMPVNELKALLLELARDPFLRADAVEQMLARRHGLAPRMGSLAPALEDRVPRMRLSSTDKATLVEIVESLEKVEGLDRLVALIGEFGGARYGLALYRLAVANHAALPRSAWKRLATITGSDEVQRAARRLNNDELLEVFRPYGKSWERTARRRAR